MKLVNFFKKLFGSNSYGSSLEKYIIARNPQHAGDIDRLTLDYHHQISNHRII
jgi:hypothetical protein